MPGPKPTPGAKEAREERHRVACRQRYQNKKDRYRADRNERDAGKRAIEKRLKPAPDTGFALTVVNRRSLERPLLVWMGPDGTTHIERELSAQELIRRHKAADTTSGTARNRARKEKP